MMLVDEARKDNKIKYNQGFLLETDHLHTDYVVPLSASQRKDAMADAYIIMRSSLKDILRRTTRVQTDNLAADDVLLLHIDKDKLIAFDTKTGALHHTRQRDQLQDHLPAVIATSSNQPGTVTTTDYRETTVLAAWQPVADTGWFILAKADRDKILAPLWNTMGWVVLVGIFLITAIIALLHILWNRQQYYHQLEELAHETQTDKLLKHFFDMPFVGMAIWSARDGHWLRFNDRLCDMLGYSREQLQKMRWEDLTEPDDLAEEKEALKRVIKGKTESYAVERRMRRRDGTHMHANIDVHCVRSGKGRAELLVAIIQDVSSYQLTIEALRESEDRFRTIFDSVLDGILVIAPETHTFIAANDAFCRMLGYSNDEIAGMSIKDIYPDEYQNQIEGVLTDVMQKKSMDYTVNMPVIRKDGSTIFADLLGSSAKIGDRQFILAVFNDTTERQTMIQALSNNEQRLRTLINTIPDLVWLKDANGVYQICNARFEEFFGAREGEIIGKTDHDFVNKELADFFREHDRIAMQAEKPSVNEESVTFASDGHTEVLETIKSPLVDDQGNTVGVLGIGRNITERKEYEIKLHRLSQFYAALSQCNESIIRSTDELELLQDICRITVQIEQIKTAWVGFIDQDSRKINWVAGYGDGNKEVAASTNALSDEKEIMHNPSYQSFSQDKAVWLQDISSESSCKTCHKMANTYGWRSAASLPLHFNDAVVGVLNLYADVKNAFDEDIQKLLTEMAFDISFALDNFVLEKQRLDSENSLIESEQRFRGLVEQSLAGIYIIQDDQYVYVNPRMADILGYSSYREITGKKATDLVVPEDRQMMTEQLNNLLQKKSPHIAYEARIQRNDGTIVDIGVHGALATHQGHPAVIGLIQDVTDKKRAEAQLNSYVDKLQSSLMQTVEVATMLSEMRDPYTAGHERRVAEIAVAIGTEMGLEEQELEGLRVAGYLHDIGKINIPSEILAKPGKLTDLEYEIINGHPKSGYDVLKDVDFPWPVAQVALQHHERIDGTGYPQGLKGNEILLQARITAVADVVEAMGSHRPYRPGLGIEPALNEIERGKGTLYDTNVADACLRLFKVKGYSLPA